MKHCLLIPFCSLLLLLPLSVNAQVCGGLTCIDSSNGQCISCNTASYTPRNSGGSCSTCSPCTKKCPLSSSTGTYVTNSQRACAGLDDQADCISCSLCDESSQVKIWPCLSAARSSDTAKCIPKQQFLDIEGNLRCPDVGTYFDSSYSTDVKLWNAEDLLAVSPGSRFFAESHVYWSVSSCFVCFVLYPQLQACRHS